MHSQYKAGVMAKNQNGLEKIGGFYFFVLESDTPYTSIAFFHINDEIKAAIDRGDKNGTNLFIGSKGSLWYRGLALEEESIEEVTQTPTHFNARKTIIGHTVMDSILYL